jgi:hypothetical protein
VAFLACEACRSAARNVRYCGSAAMPLWNVATSK